MGEFSERQRGIDLKHIECRNLEEQASVDLP